MADRRKIGKASREKGKRGERELASLLRSRGYTDAKRGQQYCGSNGDADVVGLPGVHIECKRVEKLNIENAMEQSRSDAKDGEIPVVAHRKDRKPWLLTMDLMDFLEIYKKGEQNEEAGDENRKDGD